LMSVLAMPASRFPALAHAAAATAAQAELAAPWDRGPVGNPGRPMHQHQLSATRDLHGPRAHPISSAWIRALLACRCAARHNGVCSTGFSQTYIYGEPNYPTGLGEGQQNVSRPLRGSVFEPQIPFINKQPTRANQPDQEAQPVEGEGWEECSVFPGRKNGGDGLGGWWP
jgi:hypothetical protein